MINYGKVYGDTAPKPVEVTAGMVYVASNVQPYTKTFDDRETSGYVFDYIAYQIDFLCLLCYNNWVKTKLRTKTNE